MPMRLARAFARFRAEANTQRNELQTRIEALRERMERGEQSLLFLNRRGYAPVLACASCGWASRC